MSHSHIIELDTTDSTNNYAMRLIDADKAQPGLTVTALSQTGGKGQRGRTWTDVPGQSLLMTVLAAPGRPVTDQFVFNSCVAVSIAKVLQKLNADWRVNIKWPNDIILNDKKAGGILIENVLRGSRWIHSVIGLGLNIRQESFPPELPYATSLKIASGINYDLAVVRDAIRESIVNATGNPLAAINMDEYNGMLYRRGQKQAFRKGEDIFEATILGARTDGSLEVQLEDGSIACHYHGQVTWEWA